MMPSSRLQPSRKGCRWARSRRKRSRRNGANKSRILREMARAAHAYQWPSNSKRTNPSRSLRRGGRGHMGTKDRAVDRPAVIDRPCDALSRRAHAQWRSGSSTRSAPIHCSARRCDGAVAHGAVAQRNEELHACVQGRVIGAAGPHHPCIPCIELHTNDAVSIFTVPAFLHSQSLLPSGVGMRPSW